MNAGQRAWFEGRKLRKRVGGSDGGLNGRRLAEYKRARKTQKSTKEHKRARKNTESTKEHCSRKMMVNVGDGDKNWAQVQQMELSLKGN